MKNKKVIIVSITYFPKWYKGKVKSIKHTDKIRGDLALEAIKKAVEMGYQYIVVDGKSSPSFRKELKGIKNIYIVNRRSNQRSSARRLGFKKAAKLESVKAVVITEAEKVDFITECLQKVVKPILEDKADIVVPKRNGDFFKKTYPEYQYESETEGNRLYNTYLQVHGLLPSHLKDLDIFFGPRAYLNTVKVRSLFMKRFKIHFRNWIESKIYDPEEYANAQFFPIISAINKGLRVQSVEVPFKYPLMQKENEEIGLREVFIEKRKMQRLSVLVDLMHFLNYLEKLHKKKK